jgi:DNA-binding response OmpR family regulator
LKVRVGVLSKDSEVHESVTNEISGKEVIKYRSVNLIKQEDIEVLLIDVDVFSDEDSFQFNLSRIRKKILNVPVILIIKSSKKEAIDFDWFFDDFVLFPLRKGELKMRLAKNLGSGLVSGDEDVIVVGEIIINLKEYSVYYANEKIDFTYKEFELLKYLIQNSGQVFSRKDLLNKIWGVEYIGGTRTVDVHIRRLRSKLGPDFNELIETVRNVGYRCIKI